MVLTLALSLILISSSWSVVGELALSLRIGVVGGSLAISETLFDGASHLLVSLPSVLVGILVVVWPSSLALVPLATLASILGLVASVDIFTGRVVPVVSLTSTVVVSVGDRVSLSRGIGASLLLLLLDVFVQRDVNVNLLAHLF